MIVFSWIFTLLCLGISISLFFIYFLLDTFPYISRDTMWLLDTSTIYLLKFIFMIGYFSAILIANGTVREKTFFYIVNFFYSNFFFDSFIHKQFKGRGPHFWFIILFIFIVWLLLKSLSWLDPTLITKAFVNIDIAYHIIKNSMFVDMPMTPDGIALPDLEFGNMLGTSDPIPSIMYAKGTQLPGIMFEDTSKGPSFPGIVNTQGTTDGGHLPKIREKPLYNFNSDPGRAIRKGYQLGFMSDISSTDTNNDSLAPRYSKFNSPGLKNVAFLLDNEPIGKFNINKPRNPSLFFETSIRLEPTGKSFENVYPKPDGILHAVNQDTNQKWLYSIWDRNKYNQDSRLCLHPRLISSPGKDVPCAFDGVPTYCAFDVVENKTLNLNEARKAYKVAELYYNVYHKRW